MDHDPRPGAFEAEVARRIRAAVVTETGSRRVLQMVSGALVAAAVITGMWIILHR